jgi:cytochrome bd-type quinol oxidase subunit 1
MEPRQSSFLHRWRISRLWELPPEKRPEPLFPTEWRGWLFVAVISLPVVVVASLVYVVLDQPWYVDAAIWLAWVILARLTLGWVWSLIFGRGDPGP